MIIQSTQNIKIKHIVKLQNKSYRQEHQEFIAQGLKTCLTLINAQLILKAIYLTEQEYAHNQDKFPLNLITIVSDAIMKKISTTTTPSGIVGIFSMPKYTKDYISKRSIALHAIQDPGNLGTMIRSAAALSIDTVYLIQCTDFFNPKVIQATAGAMAYIKIISTSWHDFLKQTDGIPTCALTVNTGKSPESIPLQESILVIGNEGQGLPLSIIQACTYNMTIPMANNVESLNAAIAGSIAMYLKQIKNKEMNEQK